jgi:hypothetical protein
MPQTPREPYTERELTVYAGCPARYRYEAIDGLRGGRDESAYIKFHRCVYITVDWLEKRRAAGQAADAGAGLARLAAEWKQNGPCTHAFEAFYRATAEAMVREMAATIATELGQYDRAEWLVAIGARQIAVTPDRVLISQDGVRVQRIRTGRRTKSEPDKAIYALLRRGATSRYPGRRISIETLYLGTGEAVPVLPKNDDKRLKEYADSIISIEGGDFQAVPDVRRCPNCPCYFMCGA